VTKDGKINFLYEDSFDTEYNCNYSELQYICILTYPMGVPKYNKVLEVLSV